MTKSDKLQSSVTIKAQKRQITGKKVKNLRKQGLVPAAIFGYKGNYNISVDAKEIKQAIKIAGTSKILEIILNDQKHYVYIDEIQTDPVNREIIHVSLREVQLNKEITARIPITLVGVESAPAYKEQKQLIILTQNYVELKGIPLNLPYEIQIDVSKFKANDVIHLKDISLPVGVSFVHKDEESLNQVIVTTTTAVIEESSTQETGNVMANASAES